MTIKLDGKKVFVLHVKRGYEQRAAHIEQMLGEMRIPFDYILDGDIPDLTDEVLHRFFVGQMQARTAQASCTYKHILACQAILAQNLEGALVLEDDICLNRRHFIEIFNLSVEELKAETNEPAMISYEDTRLRFVPRSLRQKGKVIYLGDRDRMAGAYYLNRRAAELMLSYAQSHRLDLPCDLIYCRLLREGVLRYYWCHPTVASQGSHTGKFVSSLNFSKGVFHPLAWQLKLAYRKLLYYLR